MVEDWEVEVGRKTDTRPEDGDTTRKRANTKPPVVEHWQQPKKEQVGDMKRKGNGYQLARHVIANARNTANVGTFHVVVGHKSAFTMNEPAVIMEAMSENLITRAVARVENGRHQKE